MNSDDPRQRIVVTGMGLVTPLGADPECFWSNLAAGKSGISAIDRFPANDLPSRIAGQIKDFDADAAFGRKEARRMDRCTQLAVAAAGSALDSAGLGRTGGRPESLDERIGMVIGTGLAGLGTMESEAYNFRDGGARRVSPFLAAMMLPNMPAGQVSIHYCLKGPSRGISTACATGADCIGEGASLIQRGLVDIALAGGTDAPITPLVMAAFASARSLSRRNDEPAAASRPFDANRDGFVMAEGAAVVVLESLASAQRRGATILAELAGYGSSSDAYHITAPEESGAGIARAIKLALADAGWQAEDVDYVNAHGTSTQLNDRVETAALKLALGERAYQIPISSTKSMIGHTLGAAGAIEFVASVMSVRHQFIHPTINLDRPDPDCDLDYAPNTGRPAKVRHVLSNSLAFGGHNACLAIKRWESG